VRVVVGCWCLLVGWVGDRFIGSTVVTRSSPPKRDGKSHTLALTSSPALAAQITRFWLLPTCSLSLIATSCIGYAARVRAVSYRPDGSKTRCSGALERCLIAGWVGAVRAPSWPFDFNMSRAVVAALHPPPTTHHRNDAVYDILFWSVAATATKTRRQATRAL
jgi:hypothetical protein